MSPPQGMSCLAGRCQWPQSTPISSMSSKFIFRCSLLVMVHLICSTSTANGFMSNHHSLASSLFADDYVYRYGSADSSVFSEDDVDYIRRLLTPAHNIDRTPIGNIISRPAHEAGLIQSTLLDLVEKIRSLDIDSLAHKIVAEDETVQAMVRSLQRLQMEEQESNGGRVVSQLSPATLDTINPMIDAPWIPAANLSECSQVYSQFVDPITNRIWSVVRSIICDEVGPLQCRQIPAVPVVTQPSWGRSSEYTGC